jgi:hypothetical protein
MGEMHKDILANFMPTRQKWFASKALFDDWFAKLRQKQEAGGFKGREREWEEILKLNVEVQGDGSVIVWRELDGKKGFTEKDRLVASEWCVLPPSL